MKIRRTEGASREGMAYVTALRWVNESRVPGRHHGLSGRLFVEVDPEPLSSHVVLYLRVSSSEPRDDLLRQAARLRDFAAARGPVVSREVSENVRGLDGHRTKRLGLLCDPEVRTIVVEHLDRLGRFGTEYGEAAWSATGRTVLVGNDNEEKLDLVQDVVTCRCARIKGRRAAANRARRAVAAAAEAP